jgi:hypothetical protein
VLSQTPCALAGADVGNVLNGSMVMTAVGQGIEAGTDGIMVRNTFERGFLAAQSPQTCAGEAATFTGINQGTDACYSLYNWDDTDEAHASLADVNWVGANGALGTNTIAVLDELLAAQNGITGDWSNSPVNNVGFDWIVTFPTKYVYTDPLACDFGNFGNKLTSLLACYPTPFVNNAARVGGVNSRPYLDLYGYDEESTTTESPGSNPLTALCNEVQMVTIRQAGQTDNQPSLIQTAADRITVEYDASLDDSTRGWAALPFTSMPNAAVPTHAQDVLAGAAVAPLIEQMLGRCDAVRTRFAGAKGFHLEFRPPRLPGDGLLQPTLSSAGGNGKVRVTVERAANGLEALKGQAALFVRYRTDAVQCAFFGMHNDIGPLGIERTGDRLGRVIVGKAFFLAPQLTGVDQPADVMVIPQQCLGLGAVESSIGTQVLAAFSQLRGLGEGGADHRAQGGLIRHRGGRDLERHGNSVGGVNENGPLPQASSIQWVGDCADGPTLGSGRPDYPAMACFSRRRQAPGEAARLIICEKISSAGRDVHCEGKSIYAHDLRTAGIGLFPYLDHRDKSRKVHRFESPSDSETTTVCYGRDLPSMHDIDEATIRNGLPKHRHGTLNRVHYDMEKASELKGLRESSRRGNEQNELDRFPPYSCMGIKQYSTNLSNLAIVAQELLVPI